MFQKLLREFKTPPSQHRGKPFWAWNGKLEPEELRRQIRIMRQMGLGGFFMHARVGLDTPYLSDEWFECVSACIDEAKKLKMEAWLYDEDRWPSGAAGGFVTKNPKYRRQFLLCKEVADCREFKWSSDILAAFLLQAHGDKAQNVKRLARGKKHVRRTRDDVILSFRRCSEQPESWFNNQTYLDTLNPEAVREFIRVTHEAYRKHYASEFGKTIPGIFTDEPLQIDTPGGHNLQEIPWTNALLKTFKDRYGYDLIPHLPELVYDVEGAENSPARYHYHDCRTHLFVQAFARQIGEWCKRNDLLFTGHIMSEDSPSFQASTVGSCMRFYEHMQAPGMDLLTEHWRVYDTAKQVSSAARQFGRKWRLTETYGCTGWDFPLEGHKALGDWQLALGINLRCQHLVWYTMSGEAKRDYPAAIGQQSPWWEHYPIVEDYFGRLNAVMTRGAEVRDLLVIHPIESTWLRMRKDWWGAEDTAKINRDLLELRDTLLSNHLDFDYGDEELLARHARVTRKQGIPRLVVGRASYKTVLAPPLLTIRSTTLDTLRSFQEAGGCVVFAGAPPTHVDGVVSSEAKDLAAACTRTPPKGSRLVEAVETDCRRVSIADQDGREIPSVLYLLCEDKQAYYLFVCNTGHSLTQLRKSSNMRDCMVRDRKQAFESVMITGLAECDGSPEEWDPVTGERFATQSDRTKDGDWRIMTDLPRLGSRLFLIPKQKSKARLKPRTRFKAVSSRPIRRTGWDASFSEPNVLVMDMPRFRIGKGRWQDPKDMHLADRIIRAKLGVRHRGGAMVQPWADTKRSDGESLPVELEYRFQVDCLPTGDLALAIETPERFDITLNGNPVSIENDCGWWVDPSLRRIPMNPAFLKKGQNTLTLRIDYTAQDGLEMVYLLGRFGVKLKKTVAVLSQAPTTLRIGDWTRQGLPFYSGSLAYHTKLRVPEVRKNQRVFLKVPCFRGTALRVLVDGQVAGTVAWEPYEVDLTKFASASGKVDLAIEVIGHRRNSHGPFHLQTKWPNWTGPAQFVPNERELHAAHQLVPCGLLEDPVLEVRKVTS